MSDAQYRKLEDALVALRREFNEYRNVNPLENSAIRAGRLRLIGGLLLIDSGGTLQVVGTANVAGVQRVTGRLEGSGVFDWTGPLFLRGNTGITGILQVLGPTTIAGTLNVTGNSAFGGTLAILGATTIDGDVTLNSDLTLASGQIRAGDVTITPTGGGQVLVGNIAINGGGSAGAQVYSTGQLELRGASGVRVIGQLTTSDIVTLGDILTGSLHAVTLDVSGAKSFRMPHPTKPDVWLRHGSTESPISATEYTGRTTIGEDGSVVVELPDYFEALNKPRNRTVQITPVGRPFAVGADEVLDGEVTVYGDPGREVFWLVKAERYGGDFLLEEDVQPEPFSED